MARGIISTILGGVAGGLEGLGVQQQRRRAEEEREREREDRLALQEAQMRNLDLASTLRAYEAGASLTPARRTDAVSRALAEAPSTISAGQRTLDAQAARPLADATRSDLDISRSVLPESALRGEFARQPVDFGRPDPDLYEVQYGDRSFRLPSQAAMARQRGEAAEAQAAAERARIEDERNFIIARDEANRNFSLHRDTNRYNQELALAQLRANQGGLTREYIDRIIARQASMPVPEFGPFGQVGQRRMSDEEVADLRRSLYSLLFEPEDEEDDLDFSNLSDEELERLARGGR
jgi:hypothetical protein